LGCLRLRASAREARGSSASATGVPAVSPSRITVSPLLHPAVYARRPAADLPFPFDDANFKLFGLARHGLWHGLRSARLEVGDAILVPAYHCGAEIEAILRAQLACRFYEATENLEPDEAELDALLGPRVRALYVIHYLGFPQNVARWRRWCDERGVLLIEDVAQASFASLNGRPLGSFGDLSIFSFHETFGLPDGAALVVHASSPDSVDGSAPLGAISVVRGHARWMLARSPALADRVSRLRRERRVGSSDGFALGDPHTPPSRATVFLLPRVFDARSAARRRANYEMLLDLVPDVVPRVFAQLPAGASPFAFPVQTSRRSDLVDRLGRRGINAVPMWASPHPSCPVKQFPHAAAWRRRLVAVPVHQELALEDVPRIATALRGGRRRVPSTLRLEPLDDLKARSEEWARLAECSRNVFATWEWISTWWRHFGRGRRLLLFGCRTQDARLVAIFPLYLWSAWPLRIVRFVGHGPGDQLGPICADGDRRIAARALRGFLAENSSRWDVFLGEQLPGDEDWSALLGAKSLRREGSPVLRLGGGSWEQMLSSWSSRLRRKVHYDERRLARDHELVYRLADDPSRLQDDLDTFFALHLARWGASVFTGVRAAFHRDFAGQALARGWLRLWFLELDGHPVAAWYGFRYCGTECHYQSGRDPSWGRASVGSVLLVHSIREALQDGADEYRFLRGDDEYKYRLSSADPGVETIGLSRGILGTAALAAGGAARSSARLRAALKRPLNLY
jgi:CelD/BcsL family acetyltransferase involved in cellulose biosynthesis